MKFHISRPYPSIPFTPHELDVWIERNAPTQIEMTDRQYALLAEIMGVNKREYRGIPIVFEDARAI